VAVDVLGQDTYAKTAGTGSVRCILECGVVGFLSQADSEEQSDAPPRKMSDIVQPGTPLTVAVVGIRPDTFAVELSSLPSDVLRPARSTVARVERENWCASGYRERPFSYAAASPFFAWEQAVDDYQRSVETLSRAMRGRIGGESGTRSSDGGSRTERRVLTSRQLTHPSFRNVNAVQARTLLRDMDVGECVIRPSSKGADTLSIAWKIHGAAAGHPDVTLCARTARGRGGWEGKNSGPRSPRPHPPCRTTDAVRNLEVEEDQKAPGAAIGASLRVGEEKFGDPLSARELCAATHWPVGASLESPTPRSPRTAQSTRYWSG